MKSAVTISLVPEARSGPFVYHDDFDAACREAIELGFDAIEVFPPSAEAISNLNSQIPIAAVGTGAGWVKHQLSLTSPDDSDRRRAREFATAIVHAAGRVGASAIIGSMQGRASAEFGRERALVVFRVELDALAGVAKGYGVPLIYEPLSRYETNLFNTIESAAVFLETFTTRNVKLLADLFHMSIEEADIPATIRKHGKHIGHVHLADSNRRPAGFGHTDFAPIAAALRAVGYDGYISAEAFPHPDSHRAAKATINAFNVHFRN